MIICATVQTNNQTVEIEADVTFRRGYFISCPKSEAEYLDPGAPDELDVNELWVVRGQKRRKIQSQDYIEEILLEKCRAQDF